MHPPKNHQAFVSLLFFTIILLFSNEVVAQKLSKKAMEARITVLEEENKNLKKELEVIQSQIRLLHNYLPKPGQDSRNINGDSRPLGNEGDRQVAANATAITFAETTHDFGLISNDASVTHVFRFQNTGELPLIVSNAKGSCGCTVPLWPKEPIAPGEFGEIQVTFNSKGKKGNQHKSITITANTNPADTRLYIKASIQE